MHIYRYLLIDLSIYSCSISGLFMTLPGFPIELCPALQNLLGRCGIFWIWPAEKPSFPRGFEGSKSEKKAQAGQAGQAKMEK